MTDVTITIPAMEAGGLLDKETPEGVWLRSTGHVYGHGAQEVQIRGPYKAVLAFIAANWGDETAAEERDRLRGFRVDDDAAEHARTQADEAAWHHEMEDADG